MTDVRAWVYRVAAALLVALGALTAVPGARAAVVWSRCAPWSWWSPPSCCWLLAPGRCGLAARGAVGRP